MSQPSSPAPWNKLDSFFRAIEESFNAAIELDPGAIADLDRWVMRFRTQLERYGIDVKDPETLFVVAASIIVSTHNHVESAMNCCDDEKVVAHLEDSTELIGYALRELRLDMRKAAVAS